MKYLRESWPIAAILAFVACCVFGIYTQGGRAQSPQPLTACTRAAQYDASTMGSTQMVAAGGAIYVCGYILWAAGTVTVGLDYGTGTNCATVAGEVTPAFQLTTQTGINDPSPYFRGLSVPSGNALCLDTSAGVAVQAIVFYEQTRS